MTPDAAIGRERLNGDFTNLAGPCSLRSVWQATASVRSDDIDTTAEIDEQLDRAAEAIRGADGLLIGAGAGMGVDSGLPDFRGPEGFWKAYPPFRGKKFSDLSTPHWFTRDPALAWGFFGHRLHLYRTATPHAGFAVLRRWAERLPLGAFVFTSNVDGQFQKAGFDEAAVFECHGSIHHLQCAGPCTPDIWPAGDLSFEVDPATIRTGSPFPTCPHCGGIARPNILMFGDWHWVSQRSDRQMLLYEAWRRRCAGAKLVAVELGAGLAIPTVRIECEGDDLTLIRINPREPETPDGGIGLPIGAAAALTAIDERLG